MFALKHFLKWLPSNDIILIYSSAFLALPDKAQLGRAHVPHPLAHQGQIIVFLNVALLNRSIVYAFLGTRSVPTPTNRPFRGSSANPYVLFSSFLFFGYETHTHAMRCIDECDLIALLANSQLCEDKVFWIQPQHEQVSLGTPVETVVTHTRMHTSILVNNRQY